MIKQFKPLVIKLKDNKFMEKIGTYKIDDN